MAGADQDLHAGFPHRDRSTSRIGYLSDFPLQHIYRDVRVCQIYEATSDAQKIIIQRALAG
jgi:alkylation response protein AidB-like acyl-CoA dehydrogenase